MKTMQFIAVCLYWYVREAVKNPFYFITILYLLFIVHKLATWLTWAMSI